MTTTFIAATLCACSDGGESGSAASSCPNDRPSDCPATPPSFASEVMPIFERRCTSCHSPGGAASTKVLTDHPNIYARRGSVMTRVYQCAMPPAEATQPTAEERKALLTWLVCGAPNN